MTSFYLLLVCAFAGITLLGARILYDDRLARREQIVLAWIGLACLLAVLLF